MLCCDTFKGIENSRSLFTLSSVANENRRERKAAIKPVVRTTTNLIILSHFYSFKWENRNHEHFHSGSIFFSATYSRHNITEVNIDLLSRARKLEKSIGKSLFLQIIFLLFLFFSFCRRVFISFFSTIRASSYFDDCADFLYQPWYIYIFLVVRHFWVRWQKLKKLCVNKN